MFNSFLYKIKVLYKVKGIVSRDFRGLQMISMDRAWVPGVPWMFIFSFLFFFIYCILFSIIISKF